MKMNENISYFYYIMIALIFVEESWKITIMARKSIHAK